MKRALVLGATGFVGKYLVQELSQNGYYVMPASRHASLSFDLTSQEQMRTLIEQTQPNMVFHLAAQSSVKKSWEDPRTTLDTNLIGTMNLLEGIRKAGSKCRILLVGSSEQYGRGPELCQGPIGEDTRQKPVTPYAISKCAQEDLGRLYANSYGLDVVMTRSFNHIGVGQSSGFVVPDLIQGILDVEFQRSQVLYTGNLTAKRDFTDVRDMVRAYRLLAEKGVSGEAYNVGSGKTISIQSVLDYLLRLAQCEIPVRQDSKRLRPSDTPSLQCDYRKLHAATGWFPTIDIRTSLTEMMNDTRNYRRQTMMNLQYPVAIPNLNGNEKKYVDDCMDTNWISSNGVYVGRFEAAFAEWLKVKHAASCCNGTVALHLPLLALGIGPGDEVLVPSFTYIATANAVKYCGANPVFVDSLPDTWNMDPEDAERKITAKTKAMIPVHLYGNPCDMDALLAVARRHDLAVIEDVAECHGGTYHGQLVGSFGQFGTFSFFGNKIITTGEGGMVVTNDDASAELIRRYKGQGMSPEKRFWFDMVGYNYRMTNIEAAIGLGQLENVNQHIADRQKVATWYLEQLKGYEDVIQFQKVTPGAESVWWMFSILLTEKARVNRDRLAETLLVNGIETRPLFYPMHIMPVYQDTNAACPVCEDFAARGLNLPTHSLLKEEDIAAICDQIKKAVL